MIALDPLYSTWASNYVGNVKLCPILLITLTQQWQNVAYVSPFVGFSVKIEALGYINGVTITKSVKHTDCNSAI